MQAPRSCAPPVVRGLPHFVPSRSLLPQLLGLEMLPPSLSPPDLCTLFPLTGMLPHLLFTG